MSVTIHVKRETRDCLNDMRRKGETYDDVVTRLILEHVEAKNALPVKESWIKACEEEEA